MDNLVEVPQSLLKDTNNVELVPFMLNCTKNHEHLILSVAPRNINSNCKFLVYLTKLLNPGDILSDALGSWNQTYSKKSCTH